MGDSTDPANPANAAKPAVLIIGGLGKSNVNSQNQTQHPSAVSPKLTPTL